MVILGFLLGFQGIVEHLGTLGSFPSLRGQKCAVFSLISQVSHLTCHLYIIYTDLHLRCDVGVRLST